MRQCFDLHTHTTFSDGKNAPEEMILEAISRGFKVIGFSDHSPVAFDPPGGMPEGMQLAYRQAVRKLKEKYRGLITVKLGMEQDFYSEPCEENAYDYIIGSVHYLKCADTFVAVDNTPEILKEGVETFFGGDFIKAAQCYFETVAQIPEKNHCDIIGHFDLFSKFNEKYHFFDEQDPAYIRAWQQACDRLLSYDVAFEINTGAVYRGWRSTPYPSPDILQYLKERGARLIYSSDSHMKEQLGYGFP